MKPKPKKRVKYIDPWITIATKFYRERKEELFFVHLDEIGRMFAKILKKEYRMHLGDEMFVAEVISRFVEKDIRNLYLLPDSTIPRKRKPKKP